MRHLVVFLEFHDFFSAARDLSTCDRLGALGSPSRLGQRLVLASARQTRVCLRVAVLSRWPQPRSVANLASPTRSRLSPWSSSSRPSKPRSRSRSPHGSLPAASSPYRGAGLCRGIPLRIRLALRGESAEPSPCVSLIAPAMKYVDLPSLVGGAPRAPRNRFTPHFAVFRFRAARGAAPTNTPRINIFPRRIYSSTLGLSAGSSRSSLLLWPAVSRDCGAEGVFASG